MLKIHSIPVPLVRGVIVRIRRDLLVTVCIGLDKCRYGIYWLLILRDQPVVRSLVLRSIWAGRSAEPEPELSRSWAGET